MVDFLVKTAEGGSVFEVEGNSVREIIEGALSILKKRYPPEIQREVQYQHLVYAFRRDYPETITLDLTSKDVDQPEGENKVKITLISPDGEELERTYRKTQSVGAIKADIGKEYPLGGDQRVVLKDREGSPIDSHQQINQLGVKVLYWSVEPVPDKPQREARS